MPRDWSFARILFLIAFVCFLVLAIVGLTKGLNVGDLGWIGFALVALGLAV
jgi:hypothetical protein